MMKITRRTDENTQANMFDAWTYWSIVLKYSCKK